MINLRIYGGWKAFYMAPDNFKGGSTVEPQPGFNKSV